MKKIYLLCIAALAITMTSAQTKLKMKVNRNEAANVSVQKAGPGVGVNQISAVITCQTSYVAGTTMDLNFTIMLNNADTEYGDSVAIVFPAGITPNTSPNNTDPIAPDISDPGPDGPEALNGVNGQVISWGNNDNNWGGLCSDFIAYPFTVNVTIAPGTTGPLTANYHVSGDGFGTSPGDFNGTFTILEQGGTIEDAAITLGEVQGTSYCSNGMLPVAVRIKNLGTDTISNFPVVYQVGANPVVNETVTDTLAPNDSIDYVFTTLTDFSAEADYTITVYTSLAGEDVTGNDTISLFWTNSIPVTLTTTSYANDFEANADFIALTTETVSGNGAWALSQTTSQSGAQALYYTASATTNAAWVFLKCMDVVANDNYRITYWTRTNTNFYGGLSISYGTTQDAAGMLNLIKPLTANTANSVWVKDSADFSPSTSGTIYIGFKGQGPGTGSGTNVRLDNINVFSVLTTGINESAASSSMTVYPNPTTGIVNISVTSQDAIVTVYNMMGELVVNTKVFSGTSLLDLSSYSAGTYFVRVTENEKVITKRITLNR